MNAPVFNCGVFCGIKHSESIEWRPTRMLKYADNRMLLRFVLRLLSRVEHFNKHTPRHTRHGIRKGE